MRAWKRLALVGVLSAVLLVPARSVAAASVYTGGGFDTCAAPTVAQMSNWLSSPYRSIGIYIGGANRACGDGNLSASWVKTVKAQGWNLVPLYVGLQAPCVSQGGLQLISSSPTAAASEGKAAADDAASRAANFGVPATIPATNPIYFDMEGYGSAPSCSQAVEAFLSSWTLELHKRGYVSGVYGSSASTIADQATIYLNPAYHAPDDVWFAHWDGCAGDLDPSYFPNQYWPNHQRLHQYLGNTTESWGGTTLSIDRDYDNGAVVGKGGAGSNGSLSCNAGNGWSPWAPVASPTVGTLGAPAVTSWGPGRLDVLVQGQNHLLYHRWSVNSGATFSAWESLGSPPGGLSGSPAAVSWGPNRIDVFVRGADTALWHMYWDGRQWRPWELLGGSFLSAPAVASWAPNRLDVFIVGAQHAMYHIAWYGAWYPFEWLGGYCLQDPAATSWGPNRIDVFALGSNRMLYHQAWIGGWTGWQQNVPGFWFSGPSAASPAVGRLDVFLESSNAGQPMGHVAWSNAWSEDSIGGSLTSAPGAVGSYRRLDVFVRGTDGNLFHKFARF
jgi:hypothetical protein